MREVFGDVAQPIEVPRRVSLLAEKDGAHVVVDAMYLMALAIEMFHGFRANQATRAGHENGFQRHSTVLALFCLPKPCAVANGPCQI
jgi:hypothetical protein